MTPTRWTRPLAALALALAFTSAYVPRQAVAQEPEPAPVEGEGSGRPFDGYFATGALAGFVMFLVCKSARRS